MSVLMMWLNVAFFSFPRLTSPTLICGEPRQLPVEVVSAVSRDSVAFTEGLLYEELDGGRLLESTGTYRGQPSEIQAIDPRSGEITAIRPTPPGPGSNGKPAFGEGLTRIDNRYYQLTYTEGVAFVYDATTWELLQTLPLPRLGPSGTPLQGWGLSRAGNQLLMSTGSEKLYFLDPATFKVIRELKVSGWGTRAVRSLNMLQVVGEVVYANVFPTSEIARIDLRTGCITGWMDLTPLLGRLRPDELQSVRQDLENVANGIAFDERSGTLFVTGKNWPRIFQLKTPQ